METINKGKIVIFSAPSGSGKTTIIKKILEKGYQFSFSVSATSRPLRGTEQNGVDYWFLTTEEFKQKIAENQFIEYEEVYPGCFYGTLRSEVDTKLNDCKNVLLDVDVKGSLNIKKIYKEQAVTIFIQPPSVEALKERLIKRATDTIENINKRVAKAEYEISFANQFDAVVINDDLDTAVLEVCTLIDNYLVK